MYWASEYVDHAGIGAMQLYQPVVLSQPSIAGVDGDAYGSSYGHASSAGIASIAEYIERQHFNFKVPERGRKSINELSEEIPSLCFAYRQTSLEESDAVDSVISYTEAFRFCDWEKLNVPHNLVSLGGLHSSLDRRLLPFVDSSGTAAHYNAMAAIHGALMEFVERQTWTAFWLGGGFGQEISSTSDSDQFPCTLQFGLTGSVRFFRIDAALPAHTVLCLWYDDDAPESACFACGLASAKNALHALEKSFREMTHYRTFLNEKSRALSEDRVSLDRIEKNALHFQKRNAYQIVFERNFLDRMMPASDFIALRNFEDPDIKSGLASITRDIFVYLNCDHSTLGEFLVAKVFSPDFFLHSDPGVRLNLHNAYSEYLKISNPPEIYRNSTCLP